MIPLLHTHTHEHMVEIVALIAPPFNYCTRMFFFKYEWADFQMQWRSRGTERIRVLLHSQCFLFRCREVRTMSFPLWWTPCDCVRWVSNPRPTAWPPIFATYQLSYTRVQHTFASWTKEQLLDKTSLSISLGWRGAYDVNHVFFTGLWRNKNNYTLSTFIIKNVKSHVNCENVITDKDDNRNSNLSQNPCVYRLLYRASHVRYQISESRNVLQ